MDLFRAIAFSVFVLVVFGASEWWNYSANRSTRRVLLHTPMVYFNDTLQNDTEMDTMQLQSPVSIDRPVYTATNYTTLLILMMTTSKHYHTRVMESWRTWTLDMFDYDAVRVDSLGDAFDPTMPIIYPSNCTDVCCKQAEMIQLAQSIRVKHSYLLEWIYFIDDDMYLLVDNIRRMLTLPHFARHLHKDDAVFGLPACATKQCTGFCGGTGYLFHHTALPRLLAPIDQMRSEFAALCLECEGWGDISFSEYAKRRGVKLLDFYWEGAHGWELSPKAFNESLQIKDFPKKTFMYHYNTRSMGMREIHRQVLEHGTNERII